MTTFRCLQLLAAAKSVVKAKTAGPAEKGAADEKKGAKTSSAKVDYGAAVLDALRNMNSKSPTQTLTNVKAPGTINPVLPLPAHPTHAQSVAMPLPFHERAQFCGVHAY